MFSIDCWLVVEQNLALFCMFVLTIFISRYKDRTLLWNFLPRFIAYYERSYLGFFTLWCIMMETGVSYFSLCLTEVSTKLTVFSLPCFRACL